MELSWVLILTLARPIESAHDFDFKVLRLAAFLISMRVQLLKYGSFLVNMSVLYLPTGCVYVTNCSRIFVRSS